MFEGGGNRSCGFQIRFEERSKLMWISESPSGGFGLIGDEIGEALERLHVIMIVEY
jgi:hypothetical protein